MTKINTIFDAEIYENGLYDSQGVKIKYRSYKDIVYVSNPSDKIQKLNIFVPAVFYEGGNIGGYTLKTAPIFMPNSVGGYMQGPPQEPGEDFTGKPNIIAKALERGYVVVSPGIRGWNSFVEKDNKEKLYTGKAPAMILDALAAVRYLKYNSKTIPGDTEHIISSGTSAGGTLSALMGTASGDPVYESYLAQMGAAPAEDKIFASNCYCATLDLENSDIAYEWLFKGICDYHFLKVEFTEGGIKAQVVDGIMDEKDIEVSQSLAKMYPEYLNSLGLKDEAGNPLTLDEKGEGSFKEYMKGCLIQSAQRSLEGGEKAPESGLIGSVFTKPSEAQWVTIEEGRVKDIDWQGYLTFITRMKAAPAFDKADASTVEGETFGNEKGERRHFTEFSAALGPEYAMAEQEVIYMMNPVKLIKSGRSDIVRHWRVRHGSLDRDTSLAVPVMFSLLLKNCGCDVDFHIPWGRPHGGDYDAPELFDWIDSLCKRK
ncbi:MAG: alpha/beta hydrolase fold domain-containing protein [Eubacteriaceae bacterium]|nr:alpha/beta hydrolase fold domain-containing protein [Eubacteriaceae bacterium]